MPYLAKQYPSSQMQNILEFLNKKAKCFTTSLIICWVGLIVIDHHKNKRISVDFLVQVGF